MRHWLQLVTKNWQTRRARSALAVLAIALGVGVVVWVTCCYESVQRGVTRTVLDWIGRSHIIIEHEAGVWGLFDENVEQLAADVPGVSLTTVHTREYVEAAAPLEPLPHPRPESEYQSKEEGDAADHRYDGADFKRIEVTGIVPEKEETFRTFKYAEGRGLRPDDHHGIVIEKLFAKELGLGLGDTILLRHHHPPQPVHAFTIVGIIDRRRASANQAPMTWARLDEVQSLCKLPHQIKSVDIVLAEPTMENIRRVAEEIRSRIEGFNEVRKSEGKQPERLQVKTTEAQHTKLDAAQGLLQFVMLLLSCVVLLTAFFIILATMGMGVTERITEMGLLRCVGVTRRQLGGLVLLQTLPLGVVGTLIGVPLGLLLQWLTIRAVPDYLGEFALSSWGIGIGVLGGLATTLLGSLGPATSALLVSPAEAARPHAGGRFLRWVWMCGLAGLALFSLHELVRRGMTVSASGTFDIRAIVSLLCLYGGAALMAPAAVLSVGRPAVYIASFVLRLRPQLLGEEIDKSPFRSASICSGLMVALSLIVGLIVWGESVKAGWQFPKEFPDAMLYSYEPLPLEEVQALRDTPGITQFTCTDDFPFSLKKPSKLSFLRSLDALDQFSRFLAIEPDEGLDFVKLTFIEGNEGDARIKLKQGGHILVTREFAQERDKHVGDTVTIWAEDTKATFTIAGVVASPGVDIAVSFFNASSFFQSYSIRTLIGSLGDAERLFGRRSGKLMLFNFDFPHEAGSRIEADSSSALVGQLETSPTGRPTFAAGSGPIPGDGPEEAVANEMLARLGYPMKAFVTARELKSQIDRSIYRVTLLLSAIPAVGLLVASLGLANLMAANVASRSRQTAMLRAIGTTKSQVARIVIGEALVLGLLGSAMGLVLGLFLARTSNSMTQLLTGFAPQFAVPWGSVAAGAGLATILCIIAALIPAHYASRSNIVSVLSDG